MMKQVSKLCVHRTDTASDRDVQFQCEAAISISAATACESGVHDISAYYCHNTSAGDALQNE